MLTKPSYQYIIPAYLLFVPLLFSSGTCSEVSPDSAVDAHSYVQVKEEQVRYDEMISLTFTNKGSQKVAIMTSGCSNRDGAYLPLLVIEKQKDSKWINAGAPVCIEIATPPIILQSGQDTTLAIPANLGLDESQLDGNFRYVFDIRMGAKNGFTAASKVPKELRTTGTVHIKK